MASSFSVSFVSYQDNTAPSMPIPSHAIQSIITLGFSRDEAIVSLNAFNGNVERAAHHLFVERDRAKAEPKANESSVRGPDSLLLSRNRRASALSKSGTQNERFLSIA